MVTPITKDEIKELVHQAYATYNQQLYELDKIVTYRAWYALLHDLPNDEVVAAFVKLATFEKYMPRPGDVRRAVIDYQTKIPKHLDGYSSWGIFQTIVREVNSGVQTNIPKPEALVKTLKQLGDAAYGMHTNGDRDVFVRVYDKIVEGLEQEKYAIKPIPAI
ncbi:MAG: hypothetical protein O2887_18855 [Bacteroidetes bacterium]|nr:hypothetical protein [Bacteroidota bacterium]